MYGLIGKNLKHSYSKLIHEELYVEQYNLIELQELDAFFTSKKFKGLNVTIPFKKDVIKYCDNLSEIARDSNSVNTIINDDGVLYGYNTDYSGLKFTIKFNNIILQNKNILILGNGSTSRIVKRYCLESNCMNITTATRNPHADEVSLDDINLRNDYHIIFNTTPVGMYPDNYESIKINFVKLNNLEVVIDLIYNPLETELLCEARKNNIKTINGLLMLIHQAVKANELFHDRSYDEEITINLYKKILLKTLNFVLIGMPMSGKSHFAKILAKVYEKKYVDVDWLIEDLSNDTIEDIFSQKGEEAFRKMETINIKSISKSTNLTISTGGGAILDNKNVDYLKQNGIIIFLDVPLEMLKRFNPKNRPLLNKMHNIETLYNNRYHLYQKFADITIVKDSFDSDKTLKKIEVSINEYIDSKWSKSQ